MSELLHSHEESFIFSMTDISLDKFSVLGRSGDTQRVVMGFSESSSFVEKSLWLRFLWVRTPCWFSEWVLRFMRQEPPGIPISLTWCLCEGNQDLHENLDTEQALFRLTPGIFLVRGGLLVGVVVGFCVGSAFTAFVSGWFRYSGNLVANRSPGERLTQITPGVRSLRLVTSDWRMSEGLSDELMLFDSSKTPTWIHVVSLESVGYTVRPVEAGRICALPVEVAPLGGSLFEVVLAVDLDPDVTSQETLLVC